MWTQIAGKIRLALSPPINHWWQTTLYVTSRGLTTSPIPHGGRTFQMDFDFIDHVLRIETSDGKSRELALAPRTVSDFYAETMSALGELALPVKIWTTPAEVADPIPFEKDEKHRSYDREAIAAPLARAAADEPGLPGVPGAFPRQVQPRSLLLGWLRPRGDAVLGTTGAAPPVRTGHARLHHPRGVLARVQQRGLLARQRRRPRSDLLCVRVSGAGRLRRGSGPAGRILEPRFRNSSFLTKRSGRRPTPTPRSSTSSRAATRRPRTSGGGTGGRSSVPARRARDRREEPSLASSLPLLGPGGQS